MDCCHNCNDCGEENKKYKCERCGAESSKEKECCGLKMREIENDEENNDGHQCSCC